MQQARAANAAAAAGRRAPLQIPWRGWKDILVRTYQEIQDDRLLALAAGVVFYSLLALFPAIAAGVSLYALFANAATIGKHLSIAADMVPAGALDMLRERDHPHRGQERRQAHLRLHLRARHRAVERQCRHEGDLRRAQHHLRRRGEARLHPAQSRFAALHALRHRRRAARRIALVVVFPLLLAAFGLTSSDHPIIGYLRWPVHVRAGHPRACRALPLRAEPAAGEVALDQRRQRVRRARLARGVRRCSPGTSAISPTTTRPMARSAP